MFKKRFSMLINIHAETVKLYPQRQTNHTMFCAMATCDCPDTRRALTWIYNFNMLKLLLYVEAATNPCCDGIESQMYQELRKFIIRDWQVADAPSIAKYANNRFKVDDVDAEHERLMAAGLETAMPLEDHPWGDRGFSVIDPIGNSVYLYSDREPSDEFKPYYKG
jgi:hypothetical protein